MLRVEIVDRPEKTRRGFAVMKINVGTESDNGPNFEPETEIVLSPEQAENLCRWLVARIYGIKIDKTYPASVTPS